MNSPQRPRHYKMQSSGCVLLHSVACLRGACVQLHAYGWAPSVVTLVGFKPNSMSDLSSGTHMVDLSNAVLMILPKEIDVSVRFSLRMTPSTDSSESSWLVAVMYEDEVPSLMSDTAGVPLHALLRVICSKPAIFRMTSWPKDVAQDQAVRVLSSGSPVVAEQAPLYRYGEPSSATAIIGLRNRWCLIWMASIRKPHGLAREGCAH